MQKKVIYIGFYNQSQNKKKRFSNIAAMRKMEYVVDALQRAGLFVQFVSPSWLIKSLSIESYKKIKYSNNANFYLLPSLNLLGKYTIGLTRFISFFSLFIYLLFHTKRNEKVWVYHSYYLSLPLRIAKKIKKFKIVLEIGEIYSEVWNLKPKHKNWEKKLLNATDYFAPASRLLADELGDKAFIIYHGDYRTNELDKSKKNESINIVYAGSIDEVKSGAYNTVELAKYLSEKYIINIAGYGNNAEIDKLNKRINLVNEQQNRTACVFHGVLDQNELSKLLSKCDIAVNPQKIGSYMDSAFPTKILTYLAHGLVVLSTKIKSLVESEFCNTLVFIDSENPEIIAKKIESIDIKQHHDGKNLLIKLDEQFMKQIRLFYSNSIN
jgi:Glycosyl transferases group 1